jgi:hypothetical protein
MAETEGILQTETTKSFRTAMYMLRFTPDEKAELEQKVRLAAALGKTPLSLAESLRMGANAWLDELIAEFKTKLGKDAEGDGAVEL